MGINTSTHAPDDRPPPQPVSTFLYFFHDLLGNPAQNAVKYFSTAEVLELTKDRAWLVRMTNTIAQHWHRKNQGKKRRPSCAGPTNAATVMELPQAVNG